MKLVSEYLYSRCKLNIIGNKDEINRRIAKEFAKWNFLFSRVVVFFVVPAIILRPFKPFISLGKVKESNNGRKFLEPKLIFNKISSCGDLWKFFISFLNF